MVMAHTLDAHINRVIAMTAMQFNLWLAEMKLARIAKSDAASARLIGVGVHSIMRYKEHGTDLRTALACAAVLNGLRPYGTKQEMAA